MTTNATVHDPVCHMDIEINSAAGRSEYLGKTYYFCSPGCKVDFDADPEGVLKAESEYDHSQAVDHGMMVAGTSHGEHGHTHAQPRKPWWKFWG